MDYTSIKNLILSDDFVSLVFSDKEKSSSFEYKKISARKITSDNKKDIQIERFKDKQVFHENTSKDELVNYVEAYAKEYRQVLVKTTFKNYQFIKLGDKFKSKVSEANNSVQGLNKTKNYILNEGDNIPFLIELGIMSSNRLVKANMQHKFRQINRYLEFVRDVIDDLPKDHRIHIVDFGCGKSYLTFALYHYLYNMLHLDVIIHGLDLKEDVIKDCDKLAKKLNYENLSFSIGDIANYKSDEDIDMVVSLHACDTATDYAIFQAIKWNAKIIFSVPCCQHELNKTIANDSLSFVFDYGIIKEKISSLLTDALRAELLQCLGYKSQILEFIDTEHTPKNLLIRAIRTKESRKSLKEIESFIKQFDVNPTLYRLIKKDIYHE